MVVRTNKKGQAAIEFLMTYGWMLLVVLIVGALIFSFVDFGSLLPSKLDLSNSFRGDAQRLVATAGDTDNLQFVVRYVGARTAQVTVDNSTVYVQPIGGKQCDLVSMTDASNNEVLEGAGSITFVNGQESVLTYSCTTGGQALVEGDVIEGSVAIKYADLRSSTLTLTSTGPIRVPITS